ncbi:MHYT domain-containing protein [Nocardia sp. CY41]|uniref:MHYT domain-containing protein n=1 Tax=Nocardia sp. CY41 TaxID=2608686 RepID=UPI0019165589|nr:MHYT domain-containing protein [Nocardia sp. CY41]
MLELELDHFTFGWVVPTLAYTMSVVGSILGLRCTVHARTSRWREGWLAAGAVALGGAGIWTMHFTAMLGFSIPRGRIRYDVPMTALSAAVAIVVVWLGLSIVVRGRPANLTLPLGGAITGCGVAAMHYIGMQAMNTNVSMEYNRALVALSVAIAVVASTAALWFVEHVRGFGATIGAALIMGLAVSGMHYTGMASMSAHPHDHISTPVGAEPFLMFLPVILTITLITMMLIILVGVAEIDEASNPRPHRGRDRRSGHRAGTRR